MNKRKQNSVQQTRTGSHRTKRAMATLLVGLLAFLLAVPPQAMAEDDQWAVNQVTEIIGENFGAFNNCLDSVGDAEACVNNIRILIQSGAYVAGFGFAVGVATKYIADNPDSFFANEVNQVEDCIATGKDTRTCIRLLDPRVQRLAVLLSSYRVLEPACSSPDAVCDRPSDWPHSWPWPFTETEQSEKR